MSIDQIERNGEPDTVYRMRFDGHTKPYQPFNRLRDLLDNKIRCLRNYGGGNIVALGASQDFQHRIVS